MHSLANQLAPATAAVHFTSHKHRHCLTPQLCIHQKLTAYLHVKVADLLLVKVVQGKKKLFNIGHGIGFTEVLLLLEEVEQLTSFKAVRGERGDRLGSGGT